MIGTPHHTLFRWSDQEGWDGQGMWHTGVEKRNAYRVLVG